MLAGIDEAGRGPAVGPLVVAGVAVPDEGVLREMGCRDSKRLAPANRQRIARLLRTHPDIRIEVRVIAPDVLDAERAHRSLNAIELERFCDIACALGAPTTIVDAADVDADRFGRVVQAALPPGRVVISEHKADDNHPVVGAASIIAKVVRDDAVADLGRRLERRVNMPIGSGYASDPITRAFLAAWVKAHGDVPEGTRRSWATARALLAPRAASLAEFGGDGMQG